MIFLKFIDYIENNMVKLNYKFMDREELYANIRVRYPR